MLSRFLAGISAIPVAIVTIAIAVFTVAIIVGLGITFFDCVAIITGIVAVAGVGIGVG